MVFRYIEIGGKVLPVSSKLFKLLKIAGHPLFNSSKVLSLSTMSAAFLYKCVGTNLKEVKEATFEIELCK